MGPPGGGRNDVTERLTRHLNVISIDNFSDDTTIKIFTSITDWHFGRGYESSILRLGKFILNLDSGLVAFDVNVLCAGAW